MKIIVKLYQIPQLGNYTTYIITIPSNKISVLHLKEIIYTKTSIPPSEQRLTIKTFNSMLITLNDIFPLSFFFITHNSTIYVERLITVNKNQEIKNKILSKSQFQFKYLADIGYYDDMKVNKKQKQKNQFKLNVINETISEYYEEQELMIDNDNHIKDDYIINVIKSNNFHHFKEVIEFHNIKTLTTCTKDGMNALHHATLNGGIEILDYIINVLHNDVNVTSIKGWNALHYATFKENEKGVILLLETKDIDVNMKIPDSGYTALHLACMVNNVKIVGLLLHKCDYNIVDNYGKKANEYASNVNINYLFKNVIGYANGDINITSNENDCKDKEQIKFSFLNELNDIPKPLPKVCGIVYKIGRKLPIFRERYVEINPIEGVFKRFKSIKDYPNNHNEKLLLSKISNCNVKYPIYMDSKNFSFEFTVDGNVKECYRVNSYYALTEWVTHINKAIKYAKFWENVEKKYSNVKAYLKTLEQSSSKITIEIDKPTPNNIKNNNNNNHSNTNTIINSNNTSHNNNNNVSLTSNIKSPKTSKRKDLTLNNDSQLTQGICLNSFEILEVMNNCSYGKIFKVRLHTNKKTFLMKALNKEYLIRNNLLRFMIYQCNLLMKVNNPFIIKLHFCFQTETYLYMIVDYCPGGSLAYHVNMNTINESDIKLYTCEILIGLYHLYELGFTFKNLSLKNIMICSDGHIKLADMCLDKESEKSILDDDKVFVSEDMVSWKGKGKSENLFEIGVIMYEMLTGTRPLFVKEGIGKERKVVLFDFVKESMKDFLKEVLNDNPCKRIGVDVSKPIRKHKYFEDINWNRIKDKEINPIYNLYDIKKNDLKHKHNNHKQVCLNDLNMKLVDGFISEQMKNKNNDK